MLVWNGDIVAPIDAAALLAAHRAGSALATLAVKLGPARTGNVGVDAGGRVVRLRKESVGEEVRGGEFAAVHVLGAALRPRLPARGCLVGEVYLPALRRGAALGTVEVGAWSDIGDVPAYLDANLAWLAARRLERWLGEGARVADGVEVVASVIGAGPRSPGRGGSRAASCGRGRARSRRSRARSWRGRGSRGCSRVRSEPVSLPSRSVGSLQPAVPPTPCRAGYCVGGR